jgi:hypothetical protein
MGIDLLILAQDLTYRVPDADKDCADGSPKKALIKVGIF